MATKPANSVIFFIEFLLPGGLPNDRRSERTVEAQVKPPRQFQIYSMIFQ